MNTPRIAIICPSKRPENWVRVRVMAAFQTHSAELGICGAEYRTIGEARNAGLRWARARGFDWAIFWDDDNYYGPDYCAEFARNTDGVDVLTKGIACVRHDDGLWAYPQRARFFPGHSTAVRVAAALDFPAASFAEDVEWSRRMIAAGARVKLLGPRSLVYDRRSPAAHAYPAAQAEFLRAHGPARGPLQMDDSAADETGLLCALAPLVSASDSDIFAAMRARAGLP